VVQRIRMRNDVCTPYRRIGGTGFVVCGMEMVIDRQAARLTRAVCSELTYRAYVSRT